MIRSRLTHEDAMLLWQARDVYRVQSVLKGCVVLFFGFEFVMYCSLGYWWLGILAIAFQWGLLWCLRWGLRWVGRWAHRGLWWSMDHVQSAVQTWRHTHRR
jgi:hypothetical protein